MTATFVKLLRRGYDGIGSVRPFDPQKPLSAVAYASELQSPF